ncbi:retinol dehydrogenase 12-like [Ciona intestinalis]
MDCYVSCLLGVVTIVVCVRYYVRSKWIRFAEEIDLKGKNVIITGANAGLGLELSIQFAKRNARVYMACRNTKKGALAVEYVRKHLGSSADVICVELDQSSLDSVRRFVDDFKTRENTLDILINNAAVNAIPSSITEDGILLHYATNYFGPFLLTNLLLDLLKRSEAGGRVVNIGSLSHTGARLDLDYIQPDKARFYIQTMQKGLIKKPEDILLYQNSKLMMLMFTFELARRLGNRGVTSNCVHPGIVATKMLEDDRNLLRKVIVFLLWLFAKSPEEGCQPILHCALSEQLRDVTGKYFGNLEEDNNLHEMALDKRSWEKLWEISEDTTGLS